MIDSNSKDENKDICSSKNSRDKYSSGRAENSKLVQSIRKNSNISRIANFEFSDMSIQAGKGDTL